MERTKDRKGKGLELIQRIKIVLKCEENGNFVSGIQTVE